MTTIHIYVLKCKEGKYYVGKTEKSVEARFQEHLNGEEGAEWTRMYRPISIVESLEQANNKYLELTKTLEYMEKHGINNVRGGPYCQVDLSKVEKFNNWIPLTMFLMNVDIIILMGLTVFSITR